MKLSPSTKYVLESLIPYSDANLALAFKPGLFFKELEKKSNIKKQSLRSAYYRLVKKGLVLIDDENNPHLTEKAISQIKLFKPIKLKNSYILVIFDIPESERHLRAHLRLLLKELSFQKIQQSVWATKYDYREYLTAEIKENSLENYVILYEASKL